MSSIDRRLYEILFDSDAAEGPLPLRERSKIAKVTSIMKAANALFTAVDYDAVKMDEIAARAEVSKATLYSYFQTKEMVLVALFVRTQHKIDASRERFLTEADLARPILTMARYEALLNDMGAAEFPIGLWRVVYASRVSNRALKPGVLLSEIANAILGDRVDLLSRMVAAGSLRSDLDVASTARVLHAIGRLHWETFIGDPEPDLARTNEANAVDIGTVLKPWLGRVAPPAPGAS